MTIITQVLETQAQKATTVNENFEAVSVAGLFGIKYVTTSGLTFGYYGGYLNVEGVPVLISDGTLALTASATNWVERTPAGVVSFNTSAFTPGLIPLYRLVTSGTGITTVDDRRAQELNSQVFRKNRLYNGAWRFDQKNEGGLYSVSTAAVMTVDGASGRATGGGVFSLRRVVDPEQAGLFALEVACTTADAAIAAGDVYTITQNIEGYTIADLLAGTAGAKQITVSFRMKFSVTGTYGLAFVNNAGNRSYVGEVVQNVANTEESKKVTLTLDTGGTWEKTNLNGLSLIFTLAAGTTFQATPGAWAGGFAVASASQVNFMSSISNVGYIKQMQLEQGPYATAFEFVPYGAALAWCQRYAWKTFNQGVAAAQASGNVGALIYNAVVSGVKNYDVLIHNPVTLRAPHNTATPYNPAAANGNWRNETAAADSGAPSTITKGTEFIRVRNPQVGGDSAGDIISLHIYVEARLS